MQTVNAGFKYSVFTFLLNLVFNLTASLFNCFLNARRVDSSVNDKLFKRKSCNLTSDGIKSRYDNP